MIDITKQICERCHKNHVSEKDKTGIFITYKGINIPFCNDCAIELANLMIEAVKENTK